MSITGTSTDDPFVLPLAIAQGHGEESRSSYGQAVGRRMGGARTMIAMLVITHGQFGEELLRTAQDIVGRQESVFALSVTQEMGPDSLGRLLEETLNRLPSPDGYLIMVDMLGGTPCNTALLCTKHVQAEVITGVNLYMLLSGFTHRDQMDLKSLAAKVAEDGKRAIVLAKDLLMKRMA